MSKLGLILECGPEGPDEKVLRHWISTHAANIMEVVVEALSNKRRLLDGCGRAAANLLADGCDRVVIVWDLYPSWEEGTPCLKTDREKVFSALQAANVNLNQVAVVAIESMLECWFLADERAITRYIGGSHRIGGIQKPERERRPKDRLSKLFESEGRTRYLDYADAEPLARAITNLAKLRRRCPTFARLWEKIS